MNVELHLVLSHLYHLGIAYLLAVPLGLDRERAARSAGLRTFPLVAVASCGYMLVGIEVLSSTDAEARIMYGLMTGIGFIGGGSILKGDSHVHGVSTAASIWLTGAIGMSVAWDRYEVAIVLTLINYLTLRFAPVVKAKEHGKKRERTGEEEEE